jgi:DNA-binding response OmpR family regulator
MDVVLLRWPAESTRRASLSEDARPRLLLIEAGHPAPSTDDLEDWIRVPADEADLHARVEALRRRASHAADAVPSLDADGVLRAGGGWVSLPPVESRLTASLIERYGAVVGRDVLLQSGWPAGSPGRNALDVHVLRLRRRIVPLGLAIRTVRSRGYLLERVDGSDSGQQRVREA